MRIEDYLLGIEDAERRTDAMTTASISHLTLSPFIQLSGIAAKGVALVVKSLGVSASMDARLTEIDRLQALSDQDLAARGLTREGIVAHVFADVIDV